MRTPIPLILGLVVTACHAKPLELDHHELPGLGVDLPRGFEVRRSRLDYAVGELGVAGNYDGSSLATQVRWSPVEVLTPGQIDSTFADLHEEGEGPWAPVDGIVDASGQAIVTRSASSADGVLLVSQLQCGGRAFIIGTNHAKDQRAIHGRIVASLACHPDAAQEALVHQVVLPLALDLPGFVSISHDAAQLQLRNRSTFVILEPRKVTSFDADLEHLLQRVFSGTVTSGPRDGARVPLGGKLDGQPITGYARQLTCPSTDVFAVVLSSVKVHADEVDAKLAAAPCLPPGSKSPTWPDAPPDTP